MKDSLPGSSRLPEARKFWRLPRRPKSGEEARLFVPGLKYQGTESKESADVANDRDTDAGQVIVQRIDTVNIYINGGKIVLVRQDSPDKE